MKTEEAVQAVLEATEEEIQAIGSDLIKKEIRKVKKLAEKTEGQDTSQGGAQK